MAASPSCQLSRIRPPSWRPSGGSSARAAAEHVAQIVQRRQLGERGFDRRRGDRLRGVPDLRERRQARAQPDEVARVRLAERRAAGQPLEVADPSQQGAQSRPLRRRLDHRADRGLARGDRGRIEKRPQEPLAEETGAHRRHGLVEDAEERVADAPAARLQELERHDGGLVQQHGVGGGQALEPRQVAERIPLGGAQIRERGAGGAQAQREIGDAEGGERFHPEVGAEIPAARRGAKVCGSQKVRAAPVACRRARNVGFARAESGRTTSVGRRRSAVASTAVSFPASSPAQNSPVETSTSATPVASRPVATARRKLFAAPSRCAVSVERARRDDPHDVAPQELLDRARRLQLLADRDLLPRVHEASDIAVRSMVRDARHRRPLARRQGDLEESGGELGILEEGLVEVAEPEHQDVVGIALLQAPVLPHHGREVIAISHGDGPSGGRT